MEPISVISVLYNCMHQCIVFILHNINVLFILECGNFLGLMTCCINVVPVLCSINFFINYSNMEFNPNKIHRNKNPKCFQEANEQFSKGHHFVYTNCN